MPEVFNMFWHGPSVSHLEIACMRSFIAKGHTLRVFSYEPLTLPDGVITENAETILPSDQIFLFADSMASFTNLFRYQLLLEQGGWWVDADVVCLKSEMPSCEYYWAEQERGELNGAVLKFPRQDPICRKLLELSTERKKSQSFYGELGPNLLTEALSGLSVTHHSGSTEDVYPLHYLQAHYFWLPEYAEFVSKSIKNATFVHLWNYMFTVMGIDRTSRPPRGSFLDKLYSEHGLPSNLGREDHASNAQSTTHQLSRDSIKRYLAQKWVPDLWVDKLGREMKELTIGL
jgi:hypothetical protein